MTPEKCKWCPAPRALYDECMDCFELGNCKVDPGGPLHKCCGRFACGCPKRVVDHVCGMHCTIKGARPASNFTGW